MCLIDVVMSKRFMPIDQTHATACRLRLFGGLASFRSYCPAISGATVDAARLG